MNKKEGNKKSYLINSFYHLGITEEEAEMYQKGIDSSSEDIKKLLNLLKEHSCEKVCEEMCNEGLCKDCHHQEIQDECFERWLNKDRCIAWKNESESQELLD